MDMTLGAFVEIYFRDKEGELKERSIKNKRYMIEAHILPYFENKPMNTILPSDIIQWQNAMRDKGFAQTYLRMIQNQITALFTHASKIYNLSNNPCKKVKKMGKSDADGIDFWTKDEYDKFIETFEIGSKYYVLFEILFWTGCREGEVLALTKSDIDFTNNKLHITKTYYRTDRRDIVTAPKTEQSIRTIDIPEFLKQEIEDYVDKLYELSDDARIFPIVAEAVQHMLKNHAVKAGIKRIRVHSLRHSHVAYLIHQGVQPLIIKERLGHRDIKITLNTYGHLYPSQQRQVADMLDEKRCE
jgi:integrase